MPDLTIDERKQMLNIAKGFCEECKKKSINEDDTKEMLLEVMKATAEELIKDRKDKK